MNFKKMRLTALVTTVLVSTVTGASVFAQKAGSAKNALTDNQFANLAVIKKTDAAVGKAADKSAVTTAGGLDALMGKDAKKVKNNKFGFVRMVEVKYSNAQKQTTVAQVLQFKNNKKGEAYFVESVAPGAKLNKKGTRIRKGNMLVTRIGPVVVRINSAAGQKAAKSLAVAYEKKVARKFKKINSPQYNVRPPSNSVKLAAGAGFIKTRARVIDKGRAPKEIEVIGMTDDYVSFPRQPKKKVAVMVADYNRWSQTVGKKKLNGDQQNVAKFVKSYVNRFRYFPTKSKGGYAIVGRYKGYVIGIYRLKGSQASPQELKAVLERARIKLFFGKNSPAAKSSGKPAAGAAADSDDDEDAEADDADDGEEGEEGADGGTDSEEGEESEEAGEDSESDAGDDEE